MDSAGKEIKAKPNKSVCRGQDPFNYLVSDISYNATFAEKIGLDSQIRLRPTDKKDLAILSVT